MPRRKIVTNKKSLTQSQKSANLNQPEDSSMPQPLKIPAPLKNIKLQTGWLVILVIILALLVLAYFKKSWFVAATVNGTPITNFELQKKLNDTYREQTLNQLINEQVILDAGKKNNVVATDDEINNKISSIEAQVGGAQVLDNLLSQQGQTRQSLKDQVKVQIIIEKLYASEATVSASEIDQFITQNKDSMQATNSAGQQKEAFQAIHQQKLSQIFNQKFSELKKQADIKIY